MIKSINIKNYIICVTIIFIFIIIKSLWVWMRPRLLVHTHHEVGFGRIPTQPQV